MDGAYLLGFGPRTAGAIRELAAALYGDQIKRLTDGRMAYAAAGMIGIKRTAAPEGDRSARARLAIVVLAVLLAATVLFSLASGASDASAFAVVRDWLFPALSAATRCPMRDRVIIYDIRLPRVILGVLIGAALAVSGAVMQGLFRNPLADPGLVGVSAGVEPRRGRGHRARRRPCWRR